jgi:hypothetical protein
MGRAMKNLKQDALLPAIALISLGFVIPSRPTPFPQVACHETVSKDSKRGTGTRTEDLELAHGVHPARRSARGGGGWAGR